MLLPKIVGIDLDNTIINYNNAFNYAAIKLNLLTEDWFKSNLFLGNGISPKNLIKIAILNKKDGQKNWEFLQGQVYGNFIQHAEIFPGVNNFLFHCYNRGIKVFIVSHKTEFGHHDKSATPLRKAAIKFLKEKKILNIDYSPSRKDVFFFDTREKKVNKIDVLSCNYFIDDLPEVFLEPNFPKKTKKIIFSPVGQISEKNTFNNWYKINEYFFDDIKISDISAYVKYGLKTQVENINKIKGRANSTIYKIEMQKGEKYAGKLYPDNTHDIRKRLKNEINAYKFMHLNKINYITKYKWFDYNLNFGLYEWIDGSEIKKVKDSEIIDASSFIQSLAVISKNTDYNNFEMASAACLSGKMIENQIIERYKKIKDYSHLSPHLNNFLNNNLMIIYEKIIENSTKRWPGNFNHKLNKANQFLSPSDFGFHNAIQTNDGIKFFDFEYFGWDDPVKLTCDFLLHPAMEITDEQKNIWLQRMKEIFKTDNNFQQRLSASYGLYGICWCLINLNIFLKIDLIKKSHTKKDKRAIKEKQHLQLQKSQKLLTHIHLINENGIPNE